MTLTIQGSDTGDTLPERLGVSWHRWPTADESAPRPSGQSRGGLPCFDSVLARGVGCRNDEHNPSGFDVPEHFREPEVLGWDITCAYQRLAEGRGVSELANPGATLLMLAFGPTRLRSLVGGVSRAEVEAAFAGWGLLAVEPADTAGLGWPMNKTAPQWYRFRWAHDTRPA
jgi:hypothetical protein